MRRVVIVGVGLIGGSVALATRRRYPGCSIVGVGPDPAAFNGVVDEARIDLPDSADLVVIATPVSAVASVLNRVDRRTLVTDVASTKRSIVRAAEALQLRFVGGHPMAGGDRRGAGHARADLFDGALCVVTPTDSTDPADAAAVEAFWASLGMTVRRMSAQDHDRRVATASHVPHAVAAAVVSVQTPESLAVAATGFRDATRIAAGDPGLWRDVLLDNRDHVAADLRRVREELTCLIDQLDAGDADGVRAWLAAAAARRGL